MLNKAAYRLRKDGKSDHASWWVFPVVWCRWWIVSDPERIPVAHHTSAHGAQMYISWYELLECDQLNKIGTRPKHFLGCKMTIPVCGVSSGGQLYQMQHWDQGEPKQGESNNQLINEFIKSWSIKWFTELFFFFSLATCIKIAVFWMKINCKTNSLMVTSTKVALISTEQQYIKQYWMSIQIRYRSCNVLVPNSGSRYQRYQMLVSVMKTVPFLYRHVYWESHSAVFGSAHRTGWMPGAVPTARPSFVCMMTSSNGNIFRVTGHLCGEFTGPRWIPRTKASDAGLWCFLWCASE